MNTPFEFLAAVEIVHNSSIGHDKVYGVGSSIVVPEGGNSNDVRINHFNFFGRREQVMSSIVRCRAGAALAQFNHLEYGQRLSKALSGFQRSAGSTQKGWHCAVFERTFHHDVLQAKLSHGYHECFEAAYLSLQDFRSANRSGFARHNPSRTYQSVTGLEFYTYLCELAGPPAPLETPMPTIIVTRRRRAITL